MDIKTIKAKNVESVVFSKNYLKVLLEQRPSLRGIEHEFVMGRTIYLPDRTINVCKYCMYGENNINHIKIEKN